MARKKLTKTQIKNTLKTIDNAFGKLLSDRYFHGSESLVPMSTKKLIENAMPIQRLRQRFK